MRVRKPNNRPAGLRRRGIVLLIVLGMLSLFTVLVVSFVVFSSQMANSAASSQQRRQEEILPEPPVESAIVQLIVGTEDHKSAAFGESILEDLYGSDGLQMRVGHRRGRVIPPPFDTRLMPLISGGQLLLPLDGNGDPQTTLFKFPTNLAHWFYDGNPAVVDLPPGVVDVIPDGDLNDNLIPDEDEGLFPGINIRPHLDDALAGRIVTFEEGPLQGVSFRVVRSFGRDNGNTGLGTVITNPPEYNLAGNFVVDLSEVGSEFVTVDGVTEQLYVIAATAPMRLLYGPGPDEQPGIANFDDDGINGADDPGELGTPFTDDVGFKIVLNGATFNGRGLNPAGVNGITRDGNVLDPVVPVEFSVNTRLTGENYRGGNATIGLYPELDEAWDAPDFENMYLAWQPSDHRRAFVGPGNIVYSGVNSDRLNEQLGQLIIPSFHRPAIINYLMNTPIRLSATDPGPRTFAQIKAGPMASDLQRLIVLANRIRRATIRPLNFSHTYTDEAGFNYDLDADGNPFDGAPLFNGSNTAGILNQTIELNRGRVVEAVQQIEQLATWLINGPWDIDNDGDGLPDSVWVDLNLPTVVSPDGRVLKPLVAPLIEDWDGKLNMNHTGSYNQLITQRFFGTPTTTGYSSDGEYFATNSFLDSFGRGGGVGPAEIDFSHLFANELTPPFNYLGPISTNQTGAAISLDQVLRTRYGNLLNVRYGGPVYDYAGAYPYVNPTIPYATEAFGYPNNQYPFPIPYPLVLPRNYLPYQFLHFPGAGTRLDPAINSDLLARMPLPTRTIEHTAASFQGRPMDMPGILRVRKDRTGEHRFSPSATDFNTPHPDGFDVVNQPYEFGATKVIGDDTPFSPAEQVDFLEGGALNGRLWQLLGDAAQRNPALQNLLVTESRSLDSVEVPGGVSMVQAFAERIEELDDLYQQLNPAPPSLPFDQQTVHVQRMAALEFRKGSKLNLNRQLGNAISDQTDDFQSNEVTVTVNLPDDTSETETRLIIRDNSTVPVTFEANQPNNRRALEPAFPQIVGDFPAQAAAQANYGPTAFAQADFDGLDRDGDGVLDIGNDFNGDGNIDAMAGAQELLARNLYCLMFSLLAEDAELHQQTPGDDTTYFVELVPNFPFPNGFVQIDLAALSLAENRVNVEIRNRYVARRLAQWAANAVDYRDPDAKCTRLRYDPNPFDGNGFNLGEAADNTVWGMERPELQITETLALHDKRLKRDLVKKWQVLVGPPATSDPSISQDGEEGLVEPTSPGVGDSDPDQFRIPQASAFVEIQAVRPATSGNGANQPSLPAEIYTNNAVDLSRNVIVRGRPDLTSPVWRLAVGERTGGEPDKSTRFVFDADRLLRLAEAGGPRQDIPDDGYLVGNTEVTGGVIDWNDAASFQDIEDDWNEVVRHTAEIRNSPRFAADPPNSEFVTLADDDVDPTNDDMSSFRVRLTRFVLFSTLNPGVTPLRVITDNRSGMRTDNVFFRRGNQTNQGINNGDPENASALLLPGQYAVIAPRAATHFGQRNNSDGGAGDPQGYNYEPTDQRLEFVQQAVGGTPTFRLNFFQFGIGDPATPNYVENEVAGTTPYHANAVLPLICESLYPHEVDANATDWSNYITNVPQGERVDMGFNISAPLPGMDYYKAPTHKVWTSGVNGVPISPSGPATPGSYPLVDGYRNGEAVVPPTRLVDPNDPEGWHDDIPFDYKNPTANPADPEHQFRVGHSQAPPLAANGFEWSAIGTHEEAVTVFLQRLADPTRPWHAIDNPYVTIDFMPMDLNTFNGEHDIREMVDRDGDPNAGMLEPLDLPSRWDDVNDFEYDIRMDTRRKIPDVSKDRAISLLVPNALPAVPTMGNRDRLTVVKRSHLSVTTNRLRTTNESADPNYWTFNLGTMWNNGVVTPAADALDTGNVTGYRPDPTGNWLNLDLDTDGFTQSLGFVNREYGRPTASLDAAGNQNPRANTFGTGGPELVLYSMVPWMNREFQSPFDLMNVPAVSRTGLLDTFSPGTELQDSFGREVATDYRHLLGFHAGFANGRADDTAGKSDLGVNIDDASNNDYDDITGDRAGLEQIFDYVDCGPIWYDSQRWFDPAKILFRRDLTFDRGSTFQIQLHQMFNRSVETLQPPYNYVGKHRTPGKVNLNTAPDYIRKGPQYRGPVGEMLDGYDDPNDTTNPTNPRQLMEDPTNPDSLPGTGPGSQIASNPTNFPMLGGFTQEYRNSQLFGNGSVYRSLAWGISTPYELDQQYGTPATMGEANQYERTVDTQFGYGFKAFIESRRGYSTTAPGTNYMGNPELDFRYPTRFAGVFAPAQASVTGSVQRLMRMHSKADPQGMPRRTHDMSLLRPHPDFDFRTMSANQKTDLQAPTYTRFSLEVEADPTGGAVSLPALTPPQAEVSGLRMPLVNMGLVERPQAELHKNLRNLDRDAFFRHQNAARLANVSTHHSNVFLIRLTLGYFVVDPTTNAVGQEYITNTGEPLRSRATYLVDRSIPVGFLRGKNVNAEKTILFSKLEE